MPKITRSSLDKLSTELKKKQKKIKEVAQEYQSAIADGDGIHDNPMYRDKKYEMDRLIDDITDLEGVLRNSETIESNKTEKVQIGSKVLVEEIETKVRKEFILVSPEEASFISGNVSSESPMGKALLDKGIGDVVEVSLPNGVVKRYRIVKID